ncbi:hypothetical protein [Streptomyces sp. NPDC056190]|uniref:TRADD-N-associated membrane domain-containing protein n=1 Tax=Streptomyces sp. NPDC056190 TaxID=3345741 RepID=UPI0035E18FC8
MVAAFVQFPGVDLRGRSARRPGPPASGQAPAPRRHGPAGRTPTAPRRGCGRGCPGSISCPSPTPAAAPTSTGSRPLANQRFATLLIEYYAYGLTQARRSFGVSLSCSTLGGLIFLAGIAMAIFKVDSTGDQYASVTASVAGLPMTVIGTLFHRRADQALKHMESQTQSLRQDMNVERGAGQAVRLLEDVEDPALKAHLQAALTLKFSAAELPELGGVLKPDASVSVRDANGALPQQQSESPSS